MIGINLNGQVTDQNGIIYNLPWQFHEDILVETNGIAVVCIVYTLGVN